MNHIIPKIDDRTFDQLLHDIRSMIPFYTPEWEALREDDAGIALMKIYLNMMEQVIYRLNQVPEKNFIAFLEMLGIRMLPAQFARVPVTFTPAEGTTQPIFVPKGTQVSGMPIDESEELIFETENNLMVSPATLVEVYSIDAANDKIYVHSDEYGSNSPFRLFEGTNKQEHCLYIGHEDLFNQTKPTNIYIDLIIASGAGESTQFIFTWEYWNGTRWAKIATFKDESQDENSHISESDSIELFRSSGEIHLQKSTFGEIQEKEIFTSNNRWIRCRCKNALTASASLKLPTINTIHISIEPKDEFLPDLLFHNDIPLEVEYLETKMVAKDIQPKIACFDRNTPDEIVLANAAGLKVGDLLEFNNYKDTRERWKIENINDTTISDDTKTVTLEGELVYDYSDTPEVRIVTALRQENDNEVTVQTLDKASLDGLEIALFSKVYLKQGSSMDDAYISSIRKAANASIIILVDSDGGQSNPTLNRSYNEKDSLYIVPQIKPFGETPRLFDTFYIASDEAFSKKGAKITLSVESKWHNLENKPADEPKPEPVLSWEYWNGVTWDNIRVSDGTDKFENNGEITFTCPDDIAKTKVNGEDKFWIRVRIVHGDYGQKLVFKNIGSGWLGMQGEVRATEGAIYYPVIKELKINYVTEKQPPQRCLTHNNLNYIDRTNDCITINKVFNPFEKLEEKYSALFLGFDKAPFNGPLRMLFNLEEQFLPDNERLKMKWSYWDGSSWIEINTTDNSENLTRIGILEWHGKKDMAEHEFFEQKKYWMKGYIVEGRHPEAPLIKNVLLNTTYAFQATLIKDEILGSGDSSINQKFVTLNSPIISQEVWIRETNVPDEQDEQNIKQEEGDDAINIIRDEKGDIDEIWIRWHEVEDFDDSGTDSRHYVVNKRLGEIQFGNGESGMIPPTGIDNVKATYKYGGGKIGNVPADSISGLKNAISFVDSVTNHLAADGGAETETLEEVLVNGPRRLKTRNRAVSEQDFEWLAKAASRKVKRAKCIPNIDSTGKFTPGWVTILIVPDSTEDKPKTTRQLIKTVEDYLLQNSSNVLTFPDRIHVRKPDYAEIVVEATVVPVSMDEASIVENAVNSALKRYIHPLTGGKEKSGWEFGKTICLSDIFEHIESIPGVDYVEKIILYKNGVQQLQNIEIDQYTLPFSGQHNIIIGGI